MFFHAWSSSGTIVTSYHLSWNARTTSDPSSADFIPTTLTGNCARVRKSNIHSTTITLRSSRSMFEMKHHLDCVPGSIMNRLSLMDRFCKVRIHSSSNTRTAIIPSLFFAYSDILSGSIHLDFTYSRCSAFRFGSDCHLSAILSRSDCFTCCFCVMGLVFGCWYSAFLNSSDLIQNVLEYHSTTWALLW